MNSWSKSVLSRLSGTPLAQMGICSPFTIPSGIITTAASSIARIARDVSEVGFITTKTLSVEPREGYREPIIHEYYPGCFANAVGLTNPGAEKFRDAMIPLLPLHQNKPLLVSIMGRDPEEFLECALILEPIADAFELNLSCPHVKGAGQSVGSDPGMVRSTVELLKERVDRPIIPKLSPNLADLPGMAALCQDAGADGLSLINTVGPGMVMDSEANPILSNVLGGLSGAGVLPIGLKAVKEAAEVTTIPIIAAGGMGSVVDVKAYMEAGASLFAIGSALAGMNTPQIAAFFADLGKGLEQGSGDSRAARSRASGNLTAYLETRVMENTRIAEGIFKLTLESGPSTEPGCFFFLRLPGVGEKPFSPARDREPVYFIRSVGPFTKALDALNPGDTIFMRGPYGQGFPEPEMKRPLVLLGGGTGVAPIMMAAVRWNDRVAAGFVGFSAEVSRSFEAELVASIRSCRIVIDPPGSPGAVIRSMAEHMEQDPGLYEQCQVFICGPKALMESATDLLSKAVPRDRIFLAGEEIMRCGIGICGSCATEDGLRSCVDGPVLTAG